MDAGTVGGALSVAEQIEIEHALITHAHLDHTVGLAFLTDTLAMVAPRPARDGGKHRRRWSQSLRTHAFNDMLWPDFTAIPSGAAAVLGFRALAEAVEARVGDLWVTPVPVEHTVPTTGFIVHDGETGFVYSGDTGPTARLWQIAREMRRSQGDHRRDGVPESARALSPASRDTSRPGCSRREIDKMPADLPIWVYHIKPQVFEETAEELAKIDPTRIHTLEQGKTYSL